MLWFVRPFICTVPEIRIFLPGKGLTLPQTGLQIDVAGIFEGHALGFQKALLFRPSRRQTTGMVDHPVARVSPEMFGLSQYQPNEACIFFPANEAGNLPIGCRLPLGNFIDHCQNGIDQVLIQYLPHGLYGASEIFTGFSAAHLVHRSLVDLQEISDPGRIGSGKISQSPADSLIDKAFITAKIIHDNASK